MRVRPGWGWLLLPVCQALVVPREVSGQEGETLSVRCWYSRGYEGYNKYWCRGAARGSCHKVVETAGRDVPRQHGRVSITDNHIFCVVLLTVQELSMEDAGSYWCGVERAGWDIMEPVTVRVTPAPSPEPWISNTTMEFPHDTNITATGLSGPSLQVLLPPVVLLILLAMAGSAGLIHVLQKRRRRKEALQKPQGAAGITQLCSTSQQHLQDTRDTPPPRSKGPAAPKQPYPTAELDNTYDNELYLRKGTHIDSSDTEEQHSEPGDDRVYINS